MNKKNNEVIENCISILETLLPEKGELDRDQKIVSHAIEHLKMIKKSDENGHNNGT